MNLRRGSVFFGAALSLFLISIQAEAHWCDDLWASSYNIVVRPASMTGSSIRHGHHDDYVQKQHGLSVAQLRFDGPDRHHRGDRHPSDPEDGWYSFAWRKGNVQFGRLEGRWRDP